MAVNKIWLIPRVLLRHCRELEGMNEPFAVKGISLGVALRRPRCVQSRQGPSFEYHLALTVAFWHPSHHQPHLTQSSASDAPWHEPVVPPYPRLLPDPLPSPSTHPTPR